MEVLAIALAVGGPVAVAAAWSVVRVRGASVWVAMGATLGVLAIPVLVTGRVRVAAETSAWTAVGVGLLAGALLYLATVAFMAVAGRWPPLAGHTARLYDQRAGLPPEMALAIAVLVVVPGEELLWRGLLQGLLAGPLGPVGAAAAAWVAYVLANAMSGSVPILLGAVVGGAAWAALALWSGGVAAPMACHAVWTTLMIVRPPVPEPRR